jgi:hypothetical protein
VAEGDMRPELARPIPREKPIVRGGKAPEPDEIQIHIGRIEVIAVQPPAQAQPKKARAESLTLDDYLRRRDGKSR